MSSGGRSAGRVTKHVAGFGLFDHDLRVVLQQIPVALERDRSVAAALVIALTACHVLRQALGSGRSGSLSSRSGPTSSS
jgi:hypothetical protein